MNAKFIFVMKKKYFYQTFNFFSVLIYILHITLVYKVERNVLFSFIKQNKKNYQVLSCLSILHVGEVFHIVLIKMKHYFISKL